MSPGADDRLGVIQLHAPAALSGAGKNHLNTCGNPDRLNLGHHPVERPARCADWSASRPDLSRSAPDLITARGPGTCKLAGADKQHKRVSKVFEYQNKPHIWIGQRTIRCQAQLRDGTICNSGFSILSEDHPDEEIARLRTHNSVLDGPFCGACGTRYLERPDEFSMNGAHQRTKDRNGRLTTSRGASKVVGVLHRPCNGRKGARILISLPHERQKTTKDDLRILNALLNSAGILDVQRMLGAEATAKKTGISRIYDRIARFEQVFLAHEREMLRRWSEKTERSGKPVEHRLAHDHLVPTVNWETATGRRNSQLYCVITADASSGYVYRLDVDFDPRVGPLDMFNQSYFDEHREPTDLSRTYPGSRFGSAPLFSWQRPTGRLHEPQFFAACVNELQAFLVRARRRMPRKTTQEKAIREELSQRIERELELIGLIAEECFGSRADMERPRGSFKGMTTREIYTKAAHFVLLKEMLPPGRIVLTTE